MGSDVGRSCGIAAAVPAQSGPCSPFAAGSGEGPGSLRQPDTLQAIGVALDRSDSMVLVLDYRAAALLVVGMNAEARRVTGHGDDALIGQDLAMLAGPQTDRAVFAELVGAAEQASIYQNQLRLHNSAGTPFWLGLHLIPAGDHAAGRRSVIIGRDITAKLRQEEQDRAVQCLLAKVFITVDVPVYIVDLGGRVVMNNPAVERLLGVAAGALNGKDILSRAKPDCHAAILAARAQQTLDERDYQIDVTLLRADGAELPSCLTSRLVEGRDLRRFRIITVRPLGATAAPPLRITAAGCVQLVGLEEVRQSLGPRWEALKQRAMATAEHILRARLAPGDTFSATIDNGFVICFANATEEEAGFRAASIGREVRRRLIGDGEPPMVSQVFAAAAAIPPDAAQLAPAPLAALVQERVQQRLRGLQDAARARMSEALKTSSYAVQDVLARGFAEPMGRLVCLMPETERAINAALGVLPHAEVGELDTDAMLLGFAHECALAARCDAEPQLTLITLGPDILVNRKRLETCLAALNAMGPAARQQLAVFVTALTADACYQLGDVMRRLRPLCRLQGVAIDSLDNDGGDMRALGVTLLMVDAQAGRATAEWEARLKRRAATLKAQKCRLVVRGAEPAALPQLFALGADFVTVRGPPGS